MRAGERHVRPRHPLRVPRFHARCGPPSPAISSPNPCNDAIGSNEVPSHKATPGRPVECPFALQNDGYAMDVGVGIRVIVSG